MRFDDSARQSVESIGSTLSILPPDESSDQSGSRRSSRPGAQHNQSRVQRRIIVQANVSDRDLGSVIEDVRGAIGQRVQLPQGYFVQYGGQFEAQEKASRQIATLSLVAIAGILLLLVHRTKVDEIGVAGDRKSSACAHPRCLGGVPVWRYPSVASLVGFITLFGIATRNGIMLISHYMRIMKED